MHDQASQNDKYLRQNIEPEQMDIVSTHMYTQNLERIGTLHYEWKRNIYLEVIYMEILSFFLKSSMLQFIEERQKRLLEVKFSFIEKMIYGVSDLRGPWS